MASSINASLTAGLVSTADTSGIINLQSGGTTIVAVTSTGAAVTGNITASGATGGIGYGPAFSAWASNVQNGLSNGTFTKVQLATEIFDTNNNFDSATNYRFTPSVAGYYIIAAIASLSTLLNTGGTAACIYKNGTLYTQGATVGTANMYPTASVSSTIYLNGASDYIELYVFNGTGGASNLLNVVYLTNMSGSMVRSA